MKAMKRCAFSVLAAGALVLAGCSGNANDGVSKDAGGEDVPTQPACEAAVLADTQAWITNYTKNRKDIAAIPTGWDGKGSLLSDAASLKAITKAAVLPCIPQINLADLSTAPANVQTIASVLTQAKWSELINSGAAGTGGGNGPAPNGFESAAKSYQTFLEVAGRLPFFCGEKGTWPTVEDACTRELAAVFAHAAQETGTGGSKTALTFTREQTCYPRNCPTYTGPDGGKFGVPSPDPQYYGRGMKQLSYPYNYAAFSASFLGDYQALIKLPDVVASDAEFILGSGLWFEMSPQPPKPSMHDVLVGTYKPAAAAKGIQLDSDGAVDDRFAATVSIINGAVECSPEDRANSSPAQVAENQARSANRFKYFLEDLDLFGASLSSVERAYEPGTTYCRISNGNPFTVSSLSFSKVFYLDTGSAGSTASCRGVGWGQAVPLPISAEGMYDVCKTKFAS